MINHEYIKCYKQELFKAVNNMINGNKYFIENVSIKTSTNYIFVCEKVKSSTGYLAIH